MENKRKGQNDTVGPEGYTMTFPYNSPLQEQKKNETRLFKDQSMAIHTINDVQRNV